MSGQRRGFRSGGSRSLRRPLQTVLGLDVGLKAGWVSQHSRYTRTWHDESTKSKIMRNVRHRDDVISVYLLDPQRFEERVTVRLALTDICLPRVMGFSQKCELSRLGLPLRPERNAQKESVRFARALEL
jgi:hypothetical protein